MTDAVLQVALLIDALKQRRNKAKPGSLVRVWLALDIFIWLKIMRGVEWLNRQ